jgi:hypothetical protein
MTERRKLKRLVRTRMARTGESYSTALRRLSRPGTGHRDSILVRHLLAHRGLDLTEALVCGLGGGIGFLYAVFEYASMPHPVLTIVAQHHPQPWAPAVLGRLGVPYAEGHSATTAAGLTTLRSTVDTGQPVLCTVDRSRLPWHRDVSFLAAADPYPVLVLGMRDGQVRLDEGTVEEAVFAQAWAGHKKGRHHRLTVGELPDSIDVTDAVADALATTAAHLTGPVLGNSFDVNLGLSGMGRLRADLRDRTGRKGWARRFDGHLPYAMGRLDECLQREYTAPDATRPLFARYLDEVGRSDVAGLIRESGRGWHEMTRLARGGTPALDDLADVLESIMDCERRAAASMAG